MASNPDIYDHISDANALQWRLLPNYLTKISLLTQAYLRQIVIRVVGVHKFVTKSASLALLLSEQQNETDNSQFEADITVNKPD